MTLIIDVSGIAQILFHQEKAEKFSNIITEADYIITPDLFVPELANVLWKCHFMGKYDRDECRRLIGDSLNYIDSFIDSRTIWQEAFDEGTKYRHPVYDMLYAITARRNSGTLLTNDGDLAKICKKLQIGLCH
ncbi:MAG: type II toxin-antitoxin system VapC family toxin [Treponema sp.]|jgi:predicted nucleic acid-binding protein|nr:type II toxin-antitoxin system VapC family toxin [Treponema sp.]